MLPIYEVSLGEMNKISLVEKPAIEEEFMTFNKQEELKLSYDEEKHIVFGPALVVDKPIYRRDSKGREFYVIFHKDVIEQLTYNFMKKLNETTNSLFNLEHNKSTDDVYLVSAFISGNGLNPVGYEDIPEGSLFIALKVQNEDLWNDIKAGKYNGFSVEVIVSIELEDELTNLINEIIN